MALALSIGDSPLDRRVKALAGEPVPLDLGVIGGGNGQAAAAPEACLVGAPLVAPMPALLGCLLIALLTGPSTLKFLSIAAAVLQVSSAV